MQGCLLLGDGWIAAHKPLCRTGITVMHGIEPQFDPG
jgi:hypothetical protein